MTVMAGVWDNEAPLRVLAGSVHGAKDERVGGVFKALAYNLRRADGLREGCMAHG